MINRDKIMLSLITEDYLLLFFFIQYRIFKSILSFVLPLILIHYLLKRYFSICSSHISQFINLSLILSYIIASILLMSIPIIFIDLSLFLLAPSYTIKLLIFCLLTISILYFGIKLTLLKYSYVNEHTQFLCDNS